jgi:hypothetical protein
VKRLADFLYRWAAAELAWLDRLFARGEAAFERLERRRSR